MANRNARSTPNRKTPDTLVNTAPARAEVKRCVVVLGSGRSATSLITRMINALGVSVSTNLRATESEQNPEGNWEDNDVVSLHQELLKSLSARIYEPLPEGWETSDVAAQAIKTLRAIMRQRMAGTGGRWVFKDPRTAVFLPIWIRVFNLEKVVPS